MPDSNLTWGLGALLLRHIDGRLPTHTECGEYSLSIVKCLIVVIIGDAMHAVAGLNFRDHLEETFTLLLHRPVQHLPNPVVEPK